MSKTQHQYLNFPERTSQVYLNKYTVVVFLIMLKIFLFKRTLLSSLDSISSLVKCDEDEVNQMNQYQNKLSNLINNYIEANLSQVKYNYLVIIKLVVSIIKKMILFYIEIFLGTYTCLLNAAIAGSANFALDTSETLIIKVNDTIVGVTEDIQDGLDGLSFIINTLVSSFNKIKDVFTGKLPSNDSSQFEDKITISIDALKKISIPSTVLDNIDRFRNQELPNLVDLGNTTDNLVSAPFDYLNKQLASSSLNSSLSRSTILVGNHVLPIMNGTSIVCSNEFNRINGILSQEINRVTQIILVSLLIVAVLAMIPLIYGQFRDWKRQTNLMNELNEIPPGSLVSLNNVLNKYHNSIIYYLVKFNVVRSNRGLWVVSYITSPYALTVFFIGICGLLAVLLQWVLLRTVVNLSHNFMKQNINKDVMTKAATNSTANYIVDINKYLENEEDLLNEEMFGNIRNVSIALNSTLVTFMFNLNSSINDVFGRTPFAKPINTVVYCTLGRKINTIESGLTWINNSLKIAIPKVRNNMENDLVQLVDQPFRNSGVLAARSLQLLIDLYKSSLWFEFLVSIAIFSLFVIQVIIALTVIGIKSIIISKGYGDSRTNSMLDKFVVNTDMISEPKPLSMEQRQNYGYPFTNPYDANDFEVKEQPDTEGYSSSDEQYRTSSNYAPSSSEYPLRNSSTDFKYYIK